MSQQMVTEILAAHADRLIAGEEHTSDFLLLFPELRSELAPLLRLAHEVVAVLRPIRPRPAYRMDLHQALITAGYEHLAQDPTGFVNIPETRRDWVLGAAAVGSAVSVVGVIAYFWRARTSSGKTATTAH